LAWIQLEVIGYLPSRGFVYRDLKLSIVLEVRLIDLGLCKEIGPGG
jgi:hypothetical protein